MREEILPLPVPEPDAPAEIDKLVMIGVGLSDADRLVRKERWTLDTMVCQWELGNEVLIPPCARGCVGRYFAKQWARVK